MSAKRILIVDDNANNLRLAGFVLQTAGYLVDTALDATRAMSLLAQHRADLILMDIQMPGTDGLSLTRLIKTDPQTCDIPVIAFTAYAMKGDEARLLAAGCDGYLSKPIAVATFAAEVGALMPAG